MFSRLLAINLFGFNEPGSCISYEELLLRMRALVDYEAGAARHCERDKRN